jgi:hypothetical protein
LDGWVDRALKIITKNPEIFQVLIDKLESIPGIILLFEQQHLDLGEFQQYLQTMKNDPDVLGQEIETILDQLGDSVDFSLEDPEPLGFSGQPGCLIGLLIILPILIMIGTMIATFTIITCLNINGCFEKVFEGIFEGLQGLTPP